MGKSSNKKKNSSSSNGRKSSSSSNLGGNNNEQRNSSNRSINKRKQESSNYDRGMTLGRVVAIVIVGILLQTFGGFDKNDKNNNSDKRDDVEPQQQEQQQQQEHQQQPPPRRQQPSEPRTAAVPLIDAFLFPNQTLFDAAFEAHPLLSTLYREQEKEQEEQQEQQREESNNQQQQQKRIPTIFVSNQALQQQRLQWAQSLISLADLDAVLYPTAAGGSDDDSAPPPPPVVLQHGSDYRVVQKTIKDDGQEWSGTLQMNHIPAQLLHSLVSPQRGFSLIINKMHQRWTQITAFGRQLQRAWNQPHSVRCNLYLTPQPPPPPKKSRLILHPHRHNNRVLKRIGILWMSLWYRFPVASVGPSPPSPFSKYLSNKDQNTNRHSKTCNNMAF